MPTAPASEQLSAYLDGELTEAEVAELEEALEGSSELRAELGAMRKVVELLHAEGPAEAPYGFATRVIAAVEDEPMAVSWWAWLRRPFGLPLEGFAIAAAAAAVLLVALPNRGSQPSKSDDPYVEQVGVAEPAAQAPPEVAQSEEPDVGEDAEVDDDGVAAVDLGSLKQEDDLAPPSKGGPPPKSTDKGDLAKDAPPQQAVEEGTPDEPASGDVLASSPYNFTVYTDDPEAQARLQRLVASPRLRGQVVSANGGAVTGTELQDHMEADLLVRIPAANLADFEAELKRLGFRVETEWNDEALYSGPPEVRVKLVLAGGAPQAAPPPPNAAKQRKMMDELEMVEQAL